MIGEITVECLAYTQCPDHQTYPLLTVVVDMPRIYLAQANTHKMICKNTQSSRAVPNSNLMNDVPDYVPSIVGFNSKGMQSNTFLNGEQLKEFQEWWTNLHELIEGRVEFIQERFKVKYGKTIEKGIINRAIENFKFTKQILTAPVSPKGWLNFIKLRAHDDTQSEMQIIAMKIKDIIKNHKINVNRHHLPYGNTKESVVNCATISYRKEQHNQDDIDRIYDKLIKQDPPHASVMEHQGYCYNCIKWLLPTPMPINHIDLHGTFHETCFAQLRKLVELGVPIP